MAKGPTYKPDKRGIAKLLRSPGLRRAITVTAEQGAAIARVRLPKETGLLASSVRVEQTEVTVAGTPRVAAVIVVDAPYAAAYEFGTRRSGNRGQHVIASIADTLSGGRRRRR